MRIVLKQSNTGLYLKSMGKWTPNIREALSFLDADRAHDYSVYHRLTDTAIVTMPENELQALSSSKECLNPAA